MNYLSICSGIEAATVAWHSLGWKPVAFSEIEAFPSAVLAHRFPDVPSLGDMTKYRSWGIANRMANQHAGGKGDRCNIKGDIGNNRSRQSNACHSDKSDFGGYIRGHSVNLVVGGTPCQSFSVAGLRKGMDDPRGNLALVFCGIVAALRPGWVVWENVPGVLSSNGGRDFGSFIGALAKLGYGCAYRILDAQYFGVPQRRRRVFVVWWLS